MIYDRNRDIDRMAANAYIEIMKDGLRARCYIAGLVSHHIRSMAQLRRDRVAEKLTQCKK